MLFLLLGREVSVLVFFAGLRVGFEARGAVGLPMLGGWGSDLGLHPRLV